MRNLLAMACIAGSFATVGATAILVYQGNASLGGWLVAGAIVLFLVGVALTAEPDDGEALTEWEGSE